jgi:hypothetical protein
MTLSFATEMAAYLDDRAVKRIPHRRNADREADKTAENQAAFRAAVTRPGRRESGTSGTRVSS